MVIGHISDVVAPTCKLSFRPQQNALPSGVSAQACCDPLAMVANDCTYCTAVGVDRSVDGRDHLIDWPFGLVVIFEPGGLFPFRRHRSHPPFQQDAQVAQAGVNAIKP